MSTNTIQLKEQSSQIISQTLSSGLTASSKFSPVLIDRSVLKSSILFPDDNYIVRFIHCKNAYALAEMAKQYYRNIIYRSSPFVDLAKSIALNDQNVINKLPKSIVKDVQEWIQFFQFVYETDRIVSTGILQEVNIAKESPKHTVESLTTEFRIIDAEIYHDNAYKVLFPFTNLYKLGKYENSIETMMKEITEAVFSKSNYVSIMMPFSKTDIPTDEDVIAIDVLRKG